jgi:hypothetical protein
VFTFERNALRLPSGISVRLTRNGADFAGSIVPSNRQLDSALSLWESTEYPSRM